MSEQQKAMAMGVGAASPSQGPIEYEPLGSVNEAEIAALAYAYWEARGFQGGSADDDWFRAQQELRTKGQG